MEKESVVAPVQIVLDVKAAARQLVMGEIQCHPGFADLQNRLGLLEMVDGQYEKAARTFREALGINPSYFWAAANLAFALVRAGRVEEGLGVLSPESDFAPDADHALVRPALLLAAQRPEEALLALHDDRSSGRSLRDHLEGVCHLKLGDREGALRSFSRAAEACEPLGRLYRRNDLLGPGALEKVNPRDAAAPLEIMPGMHALLEFFAEIYARHGFRSRSEQSYDDAQTMWPDPARYEWNMGRLASWMGESVEAKARFMKAIELEPGAVDAHIALGLEHSAAGEFEEAEREFERAVELRPGYADVRYHLGLTYMEGGRHEDAVRTFRAALSINPSFHFARMNLALALRRMGRHTEALAEYETLLAQGRATADLYLNLGLALLEDGDLMRAEDCFREGISINPEFPLNYYYLGVASQRQGKRHNARIAWRQFLERHRESELAQDARRQLARHS